MIFVAGFAVYFVVLWALWPTLFIYPLKIFVVFLHELSHAIAGALTGGHVESITLSPREGGATFVSGGNRFLMLSAGYLGSLFWGLLLLRAASGRGRMPRTVLGILAITLLLATAVLVRSGFGIIFGIVFGITLFFASRRLPANGVASVLTVLGLTSALYALLDIRDDVFARPSAPSDANMLAQLTGIPTLFWGCVWTAIALFACWVMLRRLYSRV
ncbi:MAG: M50 family metallopeptidase [Longimicrobiales bacterium]